MKTPPNVTGDHESDYDLQEIAKIAARLMKRMNIPCDIMLQGAIGDSLKDALNDSPQRAVAIHLTLFKGDTSFPANYVFPL